MAKDRGDESIAFKTGLALRFIIRITFAEDAMPSEETPGCPDKGGDGAQHK